MIRSPDAARRPGAIARYDAIVVGAGPYGLSAAAHLLGRGLSVAVFGTPLGLWRHHMPRGMLLRSHIWATNLSDPEKRYGFERFCVQSGSAVPRYPIPINAFVEYGLWFQERAVPRVDTTWVSSIARRGDRFVVTLEDGRQAESRTVVMAIGLRPFAHRPQPFDGLHPGLVSHACDHGDLRRFRGQRVVVVGGGQSALESAALLHEAGASVQIVARRPIVWLQPDRTGERTLIERLQAPANGLAPGWVNWLWERQPYLFFRFSQQWKDRHNRLWSATAAAWLRDRIVGRVTLHEGHTIARVATRDTQVDVTLAEGTTISADHVLLGTGYMVDIGDLPMLETALRADIGTDRGRPILNAWFETSVPGLYFVGMSSVGAFGPLYRFVAGCPAAARRVAKSIASRMSAADRHRESWRSALLVSARAPRSCRP